MIRTPDSRRLRNLGRRLSSTALVLVFGVSTTLYAQDLDKVPGFVDGSVFIDIAGEEALTVEVRLPRSLLQLPCAIDEELCELVDGLELIHAVILDMSQVEEASRKARARETIEDIDRRLRKKGWERLAIIREGSSTVRVLLLLNTEETIDGLLVMVLDEDEIVFANIAGVIDLEKIRKLAEEWDVPVLKDLDVEGLRDRK